MAGDGGGGGALTLGEAKATLEAAIDFGALASQQAPAGHAIVAALDDARAELDTLNAQIPWWSAGTDSAPLPRTTDAVSQATAAIYDAAADLKVNPDQELPHAIWSLPTSVPPWGLVAAGLAAVGAAVYFWRVA